MNWNEWLSMVGHITLPELRCEVPPTQELLGMIDSVGLQQWQAYCTRLEREIVRNRWTWPERSREKTWSEGDLLKFTNPVSDWEREGQYAVVEMRGPRVLVLDTRMVGKFTIPPTEVFDVSEMESV